MSGDSRGAGVVSITGPRTPMVLSVARRLKEGAATARVAAPDGETTTVRLTSATDAQRANLTISKSGITVSADSADEPDLVWEVTWTDPAGSAEAVDQAPENLRLLAKELQVQLAGASVPWTTSAQDFWDRTHGLAGMPSGLRVVCTDPAERDGGELFLGDPSDEPAYEIHASHASLSRLFGGRSLISDELETGEMNIVGTLPEFSALIGASLKVVFGEL